MAKKLKRRSFRLTKEARRALKEIEAYYGFESSAAVNTALVFWARTLREGRIDIESYLQPPRRGKAKFYSYQANLAAVEGEKESSS